MINKLKKVKIKDILGIFIFIIVLIPSLVYKTYLKITKKEVWLICELKDMCRDNGYHFFKYMSEEHPEIKTFYAINKKCPDYNKIIKYDSKIIQWESLKHYFYYMSATKNISTHKEGNPNQALFTVLHLYLNLYNNRVFLQHGITKDNVPMFYYKNTKFKKFICGAKREFEYIKDVFGYPNENVVYTGFARFDNLHKGKIDKKQILIIPTWRRWFELENDEDKFLNSEYYKRWYSVLNNTKLINYIEENNFKIKFYPHYQMKKYINSFKSLSPNIEIVIHSNVQDLLIESALMVTDYSSVYMDFAYMKKPVIYYQFDYVQYRKSHLKEGYFDYDKDGFGEIVYNEEKVIDDIIAYCNKECRTLPKYEKRMNEFFELNDDKNCERIYLELIK